MKTEDLQPIKNEITFFMEKSFQFSFVYVGAIFAGVASVKLDVIAEWASKLHTTAETLVVMLIILLNLVYLILASSCTFATLKRGYFILVHGDQKAEEPLVLWEKFMRETPGPFSTVGWNVDNYFVPVIYIIIFLLSICAFLYGIFNTSGKTLIVLIVLMVPYGVPVWCLIQTAKLNNVCRTQAKKIISPERGQQASG